MSNLATFREAGRVGSKFFNLAPGRVGSGQGPGGSGRVGSEKSDPRPTLRNIDDVCVTLLADSGDSPTKAY